MYTKIIGTGSYLPEQVRTNADLEKMVDTSDEWIVTRTGIRERRIAGPDENVSTLGYEAAKRALEMAGIEVLEARIGYLAYAEEIASAMLKRQQAEAIVAARHKIVEGAVSMVEMALADLSSKKIIEFDDDKKATMVSNLMVVLCSDKDVTPVVNTGSLYQ